MTDPGRCSPLVWTTDCLCQSWCASGALVLKYSSGSQFSLEGGSCPLLPCAATLWTGAQRATPGSALCSWVLQDDFPSIPNTWLTCTIARPSRLKSPGDVTRLGSCSVAAHRGECFEAAHSLFRLRECNGSYYLFCLSNCFFSLLLTSILGLMTYWWVFGQTARNSFSGAQTSSPTLRLWAQSCDGGACGQWMNYMCLSSTEGPSSLWKSWIPSASRSWGWGCITASGSALVKSTSCSEGNLEVCRRWRSWSASITLGALSMRHSQVAASFDQEGSEVFGLLNL